LSLQTSRARYFHLRHGRFLQRDRKGYVDGGNLYEAFESDPARFVDPLGLLADGGTCPSRSKHIGRRRECHSEWRITAKEGVTQWS
jgi:hypothetical protein